ncbi:hypothetical protein CP532_4926 [Ophiocordyceps camponoti-leonardi (nom. inval.)]|nr:hypothetical protein CP532_4926 [Ophiocordyceps camponoti-leonardi (nom. inval.)]
MYSNSPSLVSILTISLLLWHDHTFAAPMPIPGQGFGTQASRGSISGASDSGRGHRTGVTRALQAQFRAVSLGVMIPPSRSGIQRVPQQGTSGRMQPKKGPVSRLGASPLDEGAGTPPQSIAGTPPKVRKTERGSSSKSSWGPFSSASRSDKKGRVLGKKDLPRNPNGMSDEDVSLWSQWLENPKSMPDLPSLTAGAPPPNLAGIPVPSPAVKAGMNAPVQLTIPTLNDVDPRLRGQLVALLSYRVKIDESNPPVQRIHRKERDCNHFTLFPNQAIDCHGGADFRETRTLLVDRKMTFEMTPKTKVKIRTYNDHKKEQIRSSVTESTTSVTEASRGWSVGIEISTGGIGSITVGGTSLLSTGGSGLSATYSDTKSSGLHSTESRTSEQTCGGRRFCTASDVTFSVTIKGFCRSDATVSCQKTVDACAAAEEMPTRCQALTGWRTEICGNLTRECTMVADLMEGNKPYSMEMFLEDDLPPVITGYSAGVYWLDFDRTYLYDPDRRGRRFWNPTEKWHSHPRFPKLDISSLRHPVPKIVDYVDGALKLDSNEWYYPDNAEDKRYATERKGFYGKPTAPPPTQEDVRKWLGDEEEEEDEEDEDEMDEETESEDGSKAAKTIQGGKNLSNGTTTNDHDSLRKDDKAMNCSKTSWSFDKVTGSYVDILRRINVIKAQLDANAADAEMASSTTKTTEEAQREASDAIRCFEKFASGLTITKKKKKKKENGRGRLLGR